MLLPALLLFILFLLLGAFFSSSETAFVSASPIKIDYLEKKGSKQAKLVKKLLKRVDRLLATILVGNTLVNTAAASVATFVFVSFMPEKKNQAVLLATIMTTLLILIFSEISPKTYAAYNPVKLSFIFVQPVRFFLILFYPMVKFFVFLNQLIFPSARRDRGKAGTLSEEEIKVLFAMGVKGISSSRSKMISGVLDIGSRPIREVMIPRPQVKAVSMDATLQDILELIQSEGFSRFPVYRDRLDNVEGIVHAKDVIPYFVDNKDFNIEKIIRKPFFVPEFATLENVLLQMQKNAIHFVFVVDEYGNMDGIATLEDIIEEIVGEIQDEYDVEAEMLIKQAEVNVFLVKGNASIKAVNQKVPINIPTAGEYTTIAGFFLDQFGQIPQEKDSLEYQGYQFVVEKMKKRHINTLKIELVKPAEEAEDETRR